MSTAAERRTARVRVSKLKKAARELGRTILHSPTNELLAWLHIDVWEKLRRNIIESRAGCKHDN